MAKAPKKTQIVHMLQERYGKGEEFIDRLVKIARGEAVVIETDLKGVVKRVSPSLEMVYDANVHLLDRMHGKVRNGLDVEITELPKVKNYDALSLSELETLERLTRKLDSGTVDAQFVLTEGVKK